MISFSPAPFSLRLRGRKQWTFESRCEQTQTFWRGLGWGNKPHRKPTTVKGWWNVCCSLGFSARARLPLGWSLSLYYSRGLLGPPAPIPLSVQVRRGFKIVCSSALDHTSSFPGKSWEVLAKEGEPRGPQHAAVNMGCYIPCNATKVLTPLADGWCVSPNLAVERKPAHLNSLHKVRKTDFVYVSFHQQ